MFEDETHCLDYALGLMLFDLASTEDPNKVLIYDWCAIKCDHWLSTSARNNGANGVEQLKNNRLVWL